MNLVFLQDLIYFASFWLISFYLHQLKIGKQNQIDFQVLLYYGHRMDLIRYGKFRGIILLFGSR